MLERRVERRLDAAARGEVDLGAEQRREHGDVGAASTPGSEPTNTRTVASPIDTGTVSACSKNGPMWRDASGRATHSCTPCRRGRRRGRHLGVRDAAPRRHEVHRAGAHQLVAARAVAMLDLALEEPAHGLQPGVRVRRHDHAAGCRDVVGSVVVGEAPRADRRAAALGERAPHVHRARTAERHVARGEHLDDRALTAPRAGTPARPGRVLEVAHVGMLPADAEGGAVVCDALRCPRFGPSPASMATCLPPRVFAASASSQWRSPRCSSCRPATRPATPPQTSPASPSEEEAAPVDVDPESGGEIEDAAEEETEGPSIRWSRTTSRRSSGASRWRPDRARHLGQFHRAPRSARRSACSSRPARATASRSSLVAAPRRPDLHGRLRAAHHPLLDAVDVTTTEPLFVEVAGTEVEVPIK